MASKRKFFENLFRHIWRTWFHVYWPHLVKKSAVEKLSKYNLLYGTKNRSVRAPIFHPLRRWRPKFAEHCRPLTFAMSMCTEFGAVAVCWSYSGKIDFSDPTSDYHNRLKPAMQAFSLPTITIDFLHPMGYGAPSLYLARGREYQDAPLRTIAFTHWFSHFSVAFSTMSYHFAASVRARL